MTSQILLEKSEPQQNTQNLQPIATAVRQSWSIIAPAWPLKNLIAVNPLSGFESMPFETALKRAKIHFEERTFPEPVEELNRITIKWLQVFFDKGQATIRMPLSSQSFLKSMLTVLAYDNQATQGSSINKEWLKMLPTTSEQIIEQCLSDLKIPPVDYENFLTLMLTSLPGWAAYVKYLTDWSPDKNSHSTLKQEYLAFRLVLICLVWPAAKDLLSWHHELKNKNKQETSYAKICSKEVRFQNELFSILKILPKIDEKQSIKAQFLFCIDVRSERIRSSIESRGDYETFGVAGFFGLPVSIQDQSSGKAYASCPVLIEPLSKVLKMHIKSEKLNRIKKLYQSVKYTFSTPFSLVETIGPFAGLWMAAKNFAPVVSSKVKKWVQNWIQPPVKTTFSHDSIPLETQLEYASGVLKLIGLTTQFAPLVVLCGHSSCTRNNPYASSLDCGACAGNSGGPNAQIMASILNDSTVRKGLTKYGITIPDTTLFISALHNTTIDSITLFNTSVPQSFKRKVDELSNYLEGVGKRERRAADDWAQVRPEWGLAQNAGFIVGPRFLTQEVSLDGRLFLHSYDWKQDEDCQLLKTILSGPVTVAQWINAQYLFSTLDNTAYGGGSKVTGNIVGKIGVMQGNASDLMHGLPLQSVFKTDFEPYHEAIRLTVLVYAKPEQMMHVISTDEGLHRLCRNEWVHFVCLDPTNQRQLLLKNDMTWESCS